jgi:hypothetical protein
VNITREIPSGSSSSIILFISSNSCCRLAETLAIGLDTDGTGSVLIPESSVFGGSSFRAGTGFFGGAFAKADMMLPDAVRFVVVLETFESDVL